MTAKKGAYLSLGILFFLNLFNYLDRFIISAVFPLLQGDLHLSDSQLGLLASSFLLSYIAFSPLAGLLGDRYPRKGIIASGVSLWSLATVGSGLARSYRQLLMARALIGVGEAGYATVSPSLISDLFRKEVRGKALSFFYIAMPMGSALGYAMGGYMGKHYGWRVAFFLAGGPGLALALTTLFLKEPRRGAAELEGKGSPNPPEMSGGPWPLGSEASLPVRASAGPAPSLRSYVELLKIRSFLYDTAAMAAMTFAIGGLAYWMPTFFSRERHMDLAQANLLFGAITAGAGLLGTMLGGLLGDWLQRRTPKAYFLLSGGAMWAAIPWALVGQMAPYPWIFLPGFFLAELFIFLSTGPLNASLVNVVLPQQRSMAVALNILIIHLLGDALSPVLIGKISDLTDLYTALFIAPLSLGISGLILFQGAQHLPGDVERMTQRLKGA